LKLSTPLTALRSVDSQANHNWLLGISIIVIHQHKPFSLICVILGVLPPLQHLFRPSRSCLGGSGVVSIRPRGDTSTQQSGSPRKLGCLPTRFYFVVMHKFTAQGTLVTQHGQDLHRLNGFCILIRQPLWRRAHLDCG